MSSNTTGEEISIHSTEQKYVLQPLPKYMNHTTLQKLLQKHFNLFKNEYKLKFRPKATKAIIFSGKLIEAVSFEYRNQTIKLSIQPENTEVKENYTKRTECPQNLNVTKIAKDIRDIVTPLWRLPYTETVKIKTKELRKFIRNKDIETDFIPTNNFLRNKFEFAFGFSDNENEKTGRLGFRGSSFSKGRNLVYCPLEISFIPEKVKEIIKNMNDVLNKPEYTDLIYNRETNEGILKLYSIKCTECETINLITLHESTENNLENFCRDFSQHFVDIKPITSNETERNEDHVFIEIFRALNCEKKLLEDFLVKSFKEKSKEEDKINIKEFIKTIEFLIEIKDIKNLYFSFDSSTYEGIIPSKIYKISGKSSLTQKILNRNFEISFFSFFQTNVACFENIISDIRNKLDLISNKDILLDLCCGSASIGILLSDQFRKVIGLEIDQECLPDASSNMLLNTISNYEYNIMDIKDMRKLNLPEDFDFIAILDPPRAGVPKSVIKHIRGNNNIKRLIFICCDYKKSKSNFDDLCRPTSNEYENSPFYVEKVTGYDMFPFTEKMEVIYYLFRN